MAACSYVNMPENQVSGNEDDLLLYGTLLEVLEPKFTGFCNGNVSSNDCSFHPYDIPRTFDSVHNPNCFLACNNHGQCQKAKWKMASDDDGSQSTHSQREAELWEKQDEENLKLENNSAAKSCSTVVGEDILIHKSNSEAEQSGIILPQFGAEDHVIMKAKGGRVISRHSLAERMRRERISERMKFLESLVPGCDKITGKAIMLDEIINYILSLQHQVEFLSMKLAAVDPGEKYQPDQYLSKNVYHSQEVNDDEVSPFHSLANYKYASMHQFLKWQTMARKADRD